MSFQAYLDSVEAKTGKTPQQLVDEATAKGLTQHGEILAWLKEDYGLGTGHARAMAHVITHGPEFELKQTWVAHQHWLTDPSVAAGKRNAAIKQARIELAVWEAYEGRWDLLNKPTTDAPILLPRWIRERAQEKRVGLPPRHPWQRELPEW